MVTYTERSLGETAFVERTSVGAVTMSERGAAQSPTYSLNTSVVITAITERATLPNAFYTTDTSVITDDTGPLISNVHANILYADRAEIDWDTDEPANCQAFWTTNTALPLSAWASGSIHAHLITMARRYALAPLTEKTTYYFKMQSVDAYNNGTLTGRYYFKTPGAIDNTPGVLPTSDE